MSLFDSLRFSRLIRLTFYTTSVEKLLQARLVFSRRGYVVNYSRGANEPYEEDYSSDTEFLLRNAIHKIEKGKLIRGAYFIEDTSLRIESLSGDHDYPGMLVKEWFSKTTFLELDEVLRSQGNDRRATVKSDIALKLPNLWEPIMFHGETDGHIADSPPSFDPSPMYPWLTPLNFNGWFIPKGQIDTKKTLGEMEFEESAQYDFRTKSLALLADEYDRLNAAANIASSFMSNRPNYPKEANQLELGLAKAPPLICVIGYKCAGKTTFAHIAQSSREILHMEASTFFRNRIDQEGRVIKNETETLSYMEEMGFNVVARSMVEHLDNISDNGKIITGFRTPEEILLIRRLYPECVVVSIIADPRIRYERHVRRGREGHLNSFKKFEENDYIHEQFGLMEIMNDVCDVIIVNDGDFQSYINKVQSFLSTVDRLETATNSRSRSETARCLLALQTSPQPATCDEISLATSSDGPPIRRYNVNRALKAVPLYARRVERKGHLLSYETTERTAGVVDLIIDAKEFGSPSSTT